MRISTFITCMAVCGFVGNASAQSEWKTKPSVGEEFTNSAVVAVGKVVKSREVLDTDGFIQGTFYTIQITEVLKGSSTNIAELYSENTSGRFPMEPGSSYLIFGSMNSFEGIEGRQLA